ncbi:MAG: polyamine aminopropyltransferase [bacterium]|nr:polyamine aminopropyltransferase [bacterium]
MSTVEGVVPMVGKDSRIKKHTPSILLGATMFFTGGAGLVAEYILSTVSTYVLGNSIEQFSVVIALSLLMMGVASLLQKFISDKNIIEKFIGAEILLALLIGFSPIAMYAAYGTVKDHFALIQYSFIVSIGFIIGLEIPLVMRINEKYIKGLSTNIASTLSLDYVGSFVFALLWVFFLLRKFPLTEISFIMAFVNLLVASVTFCYFAKAGLVKKWTRILVVITATFCLIIFGFVSNRGWAMELQQKLYDDPIVYSETTKYQQLVMTESKSLGEYSLFINGNKQFSSLDEHIYHEMLVHPVMTLVPDHSQVLVVGGGDGLAVRELLKYPDVENVDLVDIDPGMIRFSTENPIMSQLNKGSFKDARVHASASEGVKPGTLNRPVFKGNDQFNDKGREMVDQVASVNIFTVDADLFVGPENGKRYNVIIVDLPDPESVELSKLYSQEFYRKLNRLLSDTGAIVVQSTSPYHAKEAYLTINRTIDASGFSTLPYHVNVPSFGDWGWVMATKKTTSVDMKEEIAAGSFPSDTQYITQDVFLGSTVFGKGWLDSENTDISTLMNPVILDRYVHDGWKVD